MTSNRDPQKDYRLKKRGVTSSSTRSRRVKKASAPKPTSSSTRARGKNTGSKRVTSSDQRSRGTGARVTGSKPKSKPKSITMGGDTGRRGGKNQPPRKGPPTPGRGSVNKVGKQLRTAGKLTAAISPRSDIPTRVLAIGALAKELVDQFKKNKPKKKSKKTPMKPSPGMSKGAVKQAKKDAAETNRQSAISSFDRAFAKARKAGKKEFTWRGKRYNTKLK